MMFMRRHALVMKPSNFCTLEAGLLLVLTPLKWTWLLVATSCCFRVFSVRTAVAVAAGPRLAW